MNPALSKNSLFNLNKKVLGVNKKACLPAGKKVQKG